MDKENPVTLLGINTVFLVTAALLITLGYYLQVKNIYVGLLITELVIIPLPAFMYIRWKGISAKEAFRFNGISLSTLWKCVLITLCVYPVGLFLNLLGNLLLGMLGEPLPLPVPVAETGKEYVINILVIALAAGVGEELFFRGFLLKGYEWLGERKAVIASAILFGIFHFNIQNFIGPAFLGIVFAVMSIKTGSVAAPVVGHFINNAVSVTFMFIASMMTDTAVQGAESSVTAGVMAAGVTFWGILALAGGVAALRLFRGLEGRRLEVAPGKIYATDFIPVMITVVVFVIICASQLILIMG